MNEPWAGDVYSRPSLLVPGVAGRVNLGPFYEHLNMAIRSVDNRTLIFYEPVTWSVFLSSQRGGTGFTDVPGGPRLVTNLPLYILHDDCSSKLVTVAAAAPH